MIQVQAKTQINFAEVGEPINHELAAKMVKDYSDLNPEAKSSHFIGRNVIESILAQPGCVAIRFFNAIDEVGKQTLVYAGVDKNGRTIVEYSVVDENGKLSRVEALIGDRAGDGGPSTTTYSWFQ
ncbi:MAG: hypothetical protein ACHQET_14180 [Chitinophagales bacterium]